MKYMIVPEIQFDCWGEHFVPRWTNWQEIWEAT